MPIVVDDLCYSYPGNVSGVPSAIANVSLTIDEGEFVSIIGDTGSGKSTFVQQLNGLLLPTHGSVTVDGMKLGEKKLRAKARSLVGMVFQYPEYQLFAETVAEDVAFGPKNMGLSESEVKERVSEALSLVGLDPDEFAAKSPFELSGGEKRRAALAGVVAMRPKYLVLDEPMAGLDPKGRREILLLLENMRRKNGQTIIMVSHSMDDVARHSTKIIVLNKGAVAYYGTPREVFSHSDELDAIGLALPHAAKLALLLRKRGIDVPSDICTYDAMQGWLEGRLIH